LRLQIGADRRGRARAEPGPGRAANRTMRCYGFPRIRASGMEAVMRVGAGR